MKRLFLFDFDGTITKKDSLFEFLRFVTPNWKFLLGLTIFLIPFGFAKIRALDRGKIKERFISFYLKGKARHFLENKAEEFLQILISSQRFRGGALDAIKNANSIGETYIVTASLDIWMEPIAKYLKTGLICTRTKFENDYYSGYFEGKNCNYGEKLKRVQMELDMQSYSRIVYYGDSEGDLAMKEIVDEFHMKKFK